MVHCPECVVTPAQPKQQTWLDFFRHGNMSELGTDAGVIKFETNLGCKPGISFFHLTFFFTSPLAPCIALISRHQAEQHPWLWPLRRTRQTHPA